MGRERKREGEIVFVYVCVCVCVYELVCVCAFGKRKTVSPGKKMKDFRFQIESRERRKG